MNEATDEKMGYLRERVAALEAIIQLHQEMLREVRDATTGINVSLQRLVTLEERMLAVQEAAADSRKRISEVESEVGDLRDATGLNSHGRDLWEKVWVGGTVVVATTAASLSLYYFGVSG